MLKIIFQSTASSIFSIIFTFLASIFLARALGPTEYGNFSYIMLVVTLSASIIQFGLGQGFVFFKRKHNISNIYFHLSILFILIVSIALPIILQNYLLSQLSIIPLIFILVTTSISLFLSYTSQLDKNLKKYNTVRLLTAMLLFLSYISVFFIFDSISIRNIIIINIFISTMMIVYYLIPISIRKYHTEGTTHPGFVSYSLKLHGTTLVGILIGSYDKILLSTDDSLTNLGMYTVAFGFSRLIGIIPQNISTVLFSHLAGENENKISNITQDIYSLLFIPMFLLTTIASLLTYFLFPLIYGASYIPAITPAIILLFECMISSLGWILAQRFNTTGKPGLILIRQLISLLPLLLVFFFTHSENIIILISIAVLLSSIIRLIITYFIYGKILKENYPNIFPSYKIALIFTRLLKRTFK
ncbi:lipopolysaccharide biosynthesis protein [Morganella morganii]|uniref:Oligosaccharide flippase family protein n=1 Tax=bacterium 19GA11TI05 TaxID=2920688 RepID=A0AAU6TW91_UNCXX|nr:oligosaccharide flippase family protein [Morganella morganii]MDW7795353.1 oligosaccharide flippase family protein [Morganella morganii]